MKDSVPCVLYEDEHLLAVNKPAGMNTHAPSPYAGEGIFDWFRNREPRWAKLAIIHRLDKETSGVLVFAKSSLANRSLTKQFEGREVHKRYRLLTEKRVEFTELIVESALVRAGEKYEVRPPHAGSEESITRFRVKAKSGKAIEIEAEPITGRTHQIRAHAAARGFPILGDKLYGGGAFDRLCLHAESLTLRHPATGAEVRFDAPVDFDLDHRLQLRAAFIDATATNALRLVHGAADGWPGLYVDRLGDYLLAQTTQTLSSEQLRYVGELAGRFNSAGLYHKRLERRIQKVPSLETSPKKIFGHEGPAIVHVRETGLTFGLSFSEGYSVGLFLDQRDNRRRILAKHVGAGFPLFPPEPAKAEVLNAFAYTCSFSVCAANAGARVTSLDLSKKFLDWGKANFALNDLDPSEHDFIYGDAFDWFRRLEKKSRRFDAIILDPPTFSRSKDGSIFRVEKDYGRLVAAAMPLLKDGGVLLSCTNAATVTPEWFVDTLTNAVQACGRRVLRQHYVPQPPDFPINRAEPGYLKTLWLQIA